jgi:hypothetical protein
MFRGKIPIILTAGIKINWEITIIYFENNYVSQGQVKVVVLGI